MTARAGSAAALPLAAVALLQTGCFSVLKQGYYEVRGAHGEVLPITPGPELTLTKYQGVEFTPATTTIGDRLCPPALRRAYDGSANQVASRLKPLYPGGPPTLTIDSEIVYFQKKGLFSGGQLLVRVRLRDVDQLVTDVLVRAETQSFREGGEADLARAAVQALQQFLERRKQGDESEPPG